MVRIPGIIDGLRTICRRFNTNLAVQINRNMSTNRARQRAHTGDGHGYHVRHDSEDFKHVRDADDRNPA